MLYLQRPVTISTAKRNTQTLAESEKTSNNQRKSLYEIINLLLFLFFTISLISCASSSSQVVGKWKLIATIDSDNPYATRSSLTPTKISSDKILLFKKDGTYESNAEYCFDGIKREKPSSGKYYMKKYNHLDKLFTLESTECPGIGSDLFFSIRDKNLELQLPSVTGYRIQIFEKIN